MRAHSRKLSVAGAALVVSALLVFGVALLYVWFAPKTYSAQAMILILPALSNAAPITLKDLPLESFKQDRNLKIENPSGSSVFDVVAFAPTPEAAVTHAHQRVRELREKVRSQLKASASVIQQPEPNPRAVRPNRKAIIAISGVAALNLAVVGVICLLVGFLKNRALSAAPKMPAQTIA